MFCALDLSPSFHASTKDTDVHQALKNKYLAPSLFTFAAVFSFHSAQAKTSAPDYSLATKLLQPALELSIDAKGAVKADPANWKLERENDGTVLYTAKKGSESRVAEMRTKAGDLESLTSYALKTNGKDKNQKSELASSVFFKGGEITAFTSCKDQGDKNSVGRVCVTATENLCQTLKKGEPLNGEVLKEIDSYEMRSLALILTLRGPDHQLDNMVRSGNRLGLNSALQTTKGQLITLAKQVAAEAQALRDPAAKGKNTSKQNPTVAKAVLEESMPRLKKACVDTGFND